MSEAIQHISPKCYAARDGSPSTIHSASGGFATSFSSYFIQSVNGVVYGVTLNEQAEPIYYRATTVTELEKFRGSRYVQVPVGKTFHTIKEDLSNGMNVLFIGLPCRVSALLTFLKNSYHNLTTIDLICHGAPPTKYYIEEISYLRKKHNIETVDDIRFRSNDSMDYHLSIWSHGKPVYSCPSAIQPYFCGFLKGITLGEGCYNCKYSSIKRVGDISLGDLIGYETAESNGRKFHKKNLILLNSQKGESLFFDSIRKSDTQCYELPLSEAADRSPSLNGTMPRNSIRHKKFLRLYRKYGFSHSIRIVTWDYILSSLLKLTYQSSHHKLHLLKKHCLKKWN